MRIDAFIQGNNLHAVQEAAKRMLQKKGFAFYTGVKRLLEGCEWGAGLIRERRKNARS